MESKRKYPSDLSDQEWEQLKAYPPAPKWRGRPRLHSTREILDAVFYVLKSGCQWRMLPREFPPWKTVFHYFRKWRLDGTWERLNRAMRERLRVRLGRDPQPSTGIFDSQSAKTTGVGGEQRGFDGGKKVRGRKRHLLVDTEGLVVEARVHSAKVPDQDGIRRLLRRASPSGVRKGRGCDHRSRIRGGRVRQHGEHHVPPPAGRRRGKPYSCGSCRRHRQRARVGRSLGLRRPGG